MSWEDSYARLYHNSGVFCLNHSKDAFAKKEKETTLLRNIWVEGSTVYRNKDTNIEKKLTGDAIKTARMYAYITSYSPDTPEIDTEGHTNYKSTAVQWAIWMGSEEYADNLSAEGDDYDKAWIGTHDEDSDNANRGKSLYERAQAYAKIDPTVSFQKSTYSQWKNIDGNYVIGPFRVKFPDSAIGSTRLAGQFESSLGGKKVNDGWSFCGANGQNITVKSGSDFYIKVNPNIINVNGIELVFQAKVIEARADWWEQISKSGMQMQMFVPYSETYWTYPKASITITPPGATIVKTDAQTGARLEGMQFKIRNANGYYLTQEGNGMAVFASTNINAGKTYTTNSNGEIPTIRGLETGATYTFIETSVGNNSQYEPGKTATFTVNGSGDVKVSITNEKVFVNISGYVWLDAAKDKTEDANKRNNLYDSNEQLLDGITVRLKDRTTGETIKEPIKTSNGGKYLFDNVLIKKLGDYYIEFEYDGLTYTNVTPYIDKDNGSKSAESETVRSQFNQNFSSVEGRTRDTGFTRDANGNEKHTLSYNVTNNAHEANLINNGQYTITANTDVASYMIKDHFTYEQGEIKNINLGLYKREEPDIALVKDLQNVRLAINGYEHTYTYARRYVNEGEYGDGFNVGVKFGEKYGNMSYSRAIYKSDYNYVNENDKSKELKVYVTYELKIRNQSSNLTAQINSIADYYDTNYQIVNVGTSLDEKGNVVGDISHTETSYNEDYTKTIISTNTKIEGQKETSIYVQFALDREAVIKILNDEENLENVAEINSYSIYDGDKIYAGIDIDSNPGNCVPGDKSTYEDDTDSSPALKLEVAADREMSGKVFLDSTSGELMTGQIRQGNGKYDEEEEHGIKGVTVTLTEVSEKGEELRIVKTVETNDDGNFSISDYIPGYYILTYTWGGETWEDETYTVQNYKGTVYDSSRDQSNKNWYKEDVDTRKTDAIDNYETRQKIDEEQKIITNKKTQPEINKMDSTTPTMEIGIEEQMVEGKNYGITSIETEMEGDKFVPKGFIIKNVDFGIVERARQVLELNKDVTNVKVTLANGNVLINANIIRDNNGNVKLENNVKHIAYIPKSTTNGQVKIEVDSEIIQGAKLEIMYGLRVKNISEIDYLNSEFYRYGGENGNIEDTLVTLNANEIIDYLDNNIMTQEEDENALGKIIHEETEKNSLIEQGLLEDSEAMHELLKNTNRVFLINSLTNTSLKPIGEDSEVQTTVNFTAYKLLSNISTSDEVSFDNNAEIIKVTKSGGSSLATITGNYTPSLIEREYDDDESEYVSILPPTGLNTDYIAYTLLSISSLGIIIAGVVLIKKFVLL